MPYKLTPNNPDPYTGLRNSLVAWHFVGAEATDVLQGMVWLKAIAGRAGAEWDYHISADPANPLLQQVVITGYLGNVLDPATGRRGRPVSFIAKDTEYIGYDGGDITILEQADVTANYSGAGTPYALPPPPQAVPEAPAPAPLPPGTQPPVKTVGPRRKTPPTMREA